MMIYEQHNEFIFELKRLQLYFSWAWTNDHPDDIANVLRSRTDLCRKLDPNPRHMDIATGDFESHQWRELETQLSTFFHETKTEETRDHFESLAMNNLNPILTAFAEKACGRDAKLKESQCGNLKYDAPYGHDPKGIRIY